MVTINTNIPSLNAQRSIRSLNDTRNSLFNKLSSGFRVKKAKDDAAGLTIATRLSSQIKAIEKSERNARDAISLTEVADGALEEATDIALRIRELAVRSANATNSSQDRQAIQAEVNALKGQFEDIVEQTEFNGISLLKDRTDINFQVGTTSLSTVNVTIDPNLDISSIDVSTQTAALDAITAIDSTLNEINTTRVDLGATQSRFESAIRNLETTEINSTAARSRIEDADFAKLSAEKAKNEIISEAAIAVLAQANVNTSAVLSIFK